MLGKSRRFRANFVNAVSVLLRTRFSDCENVSQITLITTERKKSFIAGFIFKTIGSGRNKNDDVFRYRALNIVPLYEEKVNENRARKQISISYSF